MTTIKWDEAYTVSCPLCKSPAYMSCVYMPQKLGPYQSPQPHWNTPTKVPHNERRQKRRMKEIRKAREEYRRLHAKTIADPVAAERRALADLARQEHEDMRRWLAQWGHVLTKAGTA